MKIIKYLLLLLYIYLFNFFIGNIFGKLLALFSLTPFVILSGFITLILFRRDLHTVSKYFFIYNL